MDLSEQKHMARAVADTYITGGRIVRARTNDAFVTYDKATMDSAGVFLVGELERLDQSLHMPLAAVTWGRDIDLRSDVSIADEVSSFTNSTFASAGGPSPNGKSWIGKDATAIAALSLDIGKTANPLTLWGMQVGWTIPELESAQKLGRPVDQQKFAGMQLKYQMDIDEMVYIGDPIIGATGLATNANVTVGNVPTGTWTSATTPAQVLADVNFVINGAWTGSAYSVCPSKLLLPPVSFSYLVNSIVSTAGNISLLEYLKMNTISNSINGKPLDIQPCKWLTGRGVSGKNRMVAYTQDATRVRYPLVPMQRTPLEQRDIRQLVTYYARLGVTEVVYPETIFYGDGI